MRRRRVVLYIGCFVALALAWMLLLMHVPTSMIAERVETQSTSDAPRPPPRKRLGFGTRNNTYCTAHAEANNVAASSVVDEHGDLNLYLPPNFEARAYVHCTRYNLTTGLAMTPPGANYPEGEGPMYENHFVDVSGDDYNPIPCNRDVFQYGYFNRSSRLWHEPCNAAGGKLWRQYLNGNNSRVYEETRGSHICPTLNAKDGSWISLIGDSVPKLEFSEIHSVDPLRYVNPKKLRSIGGKDYISYSLKYMASGVGDIGEGTMWEKSDHEKWESLGPAMNWSQFVEFHKEERANGANQDWVYPDWTGSRQPDVIIFGAGYHSSFLTVQEFGDSLETLFDLFDKQAKGRRAKGSCQPSMFYLNNIMPAPELIPDAYRIDVPHRTFINEYWKNRAVLDVAEKYPAIQVIDFMSVELLFNDEGAHRDAVHIGDRAVKQLLLDAVLNAIFA